LLLIPRVLFFRSHFLARLQADADAAKSAAALAALQAATPLKLAAAVSIAQPIASSSSAAASLLSIRTGAAASGGCHLRTFAYHDATGATPFAEPHGIAVDIVRNRLLVADEGNDRVLALQRPTHAHVWPAAAELGAPRGLALR
jgi:hypothetical protein